MSAPVPAMRPRALLTMAEMGHGHGRRHGSWRGARRAAPAEATLTPEELAALGRGPGATRTHAARRHAARDTAHAGPSPRQAGPGHSAHTAEQHAALPAVRGRRSGTGAAAEGRLPVVDHGMGAAAMAGHDMGDVAPEGAPDGSGRVYGWSNGAPAGVRVLSYADLRSAEPQKDVRPAEREIVVRLGGNMERYIWTINGQTFEKAEPIRLRYGERARLTFVNESMMAHPMHLHGMFVQLDNGQPADRLPDKHVVSVAPGRSYSALITADQPGEWAFHCHLLFHMEGGMMTSVVVARLDEGGARAAPPGGHAGHGAGR